MVTLRLDGRDARRLGGWSRRGMLAVLLLAGLLALPAAQAHASVVQTFPPQGARLSEPPAAVWVDFSTALDPEVVTLRLIGEDLAPVETTQDVLGVRVSLTPAQELPDRGFIAQWEILDAIDGHRIAGAWSFAVGDASVVPTAASSADPTFSWALAVAKTLAYVGLALVVGGVATRAYVLGEAQAPPRLRHWELAGAALHLAGAVVFLVAQARIAQMGPLAYMVETVFGHGLAVRLLLSAAFVAWFAWPPGRELRWGRAVDVALGLLLVATYGAFGHTPKLFTPYALGAFIATAHIVSVLAWTGGLACLVLLLRSEQADPRPLAKVSARFSSLATVSVAVMTLTGIPMVFVLWGIKVTRWGGHLATPHGKLLMAMIVLGLGMLAMGGSNRFEHLKRFVTSPGRAHQKRFRSRVAREAYVGVAILVVAAGVTNLAPSTYGRSLTAADVAAACADAEFPSDCYVAALARIQAAIGAEDAFDVLEQLSLADQTIGAASHSWGHELGRKAFDTYGNIRDAIENCPKDAFQACLHGALQQYFTSLEEVRPEHIAGVCPSDNKFGNFTCLHGVGHGVLLATDYDIYRSLVLCDALDTADNKRSCHHGIFMENLDALIRRFEGVAKHDDDATHGVADPNNLSFPCDAIERGYRPACWAFQPQIILRQTEEDFFGAAGKCAGLDNEPDNLSLICYSGLGGFAAGRSHNDPQALNSLCAKMPTKNGRAACVQGFIRTAIDYAEDPAAGIDICRKALAADKSTCYLSVGLEGYRMTPEIIGQTCRRSEAGYTERCLEGVRYAVTLSG